MELHGSLEGNLTSAIKSARRFKGHPVHVETVRYWGELLSHARRRLENRPSQSVLNLIVELEGEIAERQD